MRPHPRIRKTIKWGGLVAAIIFGAAWWIGTRRIVSYDTRGGMWATLVRGQVGLGTYHDVGGNPFPPGWSSMKWTEPTDWKLHYNLGPQLTAIGFPAAIPCAVALVSSAFAWRLDTLATRRAKLGACPTCSYDRTGLAASAPCPECGAAAPQA